MFLKLLIISSSLAPPSQDKFNSFYIQYPFGYFKMVLLSLMNSSTLPHKPGFRVSSPSWVAALYYILLKGNILLRCGLNRIKWSFTPPLVPDALFLSV